MSIEAMKQALEALENNRWTHYYCEDTWYSCPKHEEGCANDFGGDDCNCGADKVNAEIEAAIASLRQALSEAQLSVNENSRAIEQAEKQEPVAWYFKGLTNRGVSLIKENDGWIPLYTTPQPQREWVGLTQAERHDIREWQKIQEELGPVWSPMMLYLYEAIEAKLKEKNG